MTTKTINLYTFDELSDSAKEKARDWYRNASCGDSFWSECVIDEAKEQASLIGFDVDDVLWSGFAAQGDGACFIGKWHAKDFVGGIAEGWGENDATTEIKKIADSFKEWAEKYPNLLVKITHRDRYCHERSVDYDFIFSDENDYQIDEPESFKHKDFQEDCVRFFKWIYKQLEKEYEYQNSDEVIDELLESNGYTFTVEGKRED